MAGKGDSLKTIFYALGANFVIFLGKAVAAALTGSAAMLAETVHSLADCGNQLLLLFGLSRAKRPPTPDYPLGYGKEIYFWSFLVALMLFSVGGVFSLVEGWHKLQRHAPLDRPWIAVAVLAFSFIAEAVSMRACLLEVNKSRSGMSLWRWFQESRQAELVVIFGEDLAALLGLALAMLAVVATMLTGDPVYDAIGTIGIGLLLMAVGVFVAIQVKAMLIGQSVDPSTHRAILEFLDSRPELGKIFSLITLQLGSDVMVAVQAAMAEPEVPTSLNITRINAIEVALKQRFPEVRWSFFEPDDSP